MGLSWCDPVAKIQIEKRQLALVPGDAGIVGVMKNALSGEIRLRGLPGMDCNCSRSHLHGRCDRRFLSFDPVRGTPRRSAAGDAAAAIYTLK